MHLRVLDKEAKLGYSGFSSMSLGARAKIRRGEIRPVYSVGFDG